MLQGLEAADGNAELLAHLEIVGRDLDGLFHAADQLGAQCRDAVREAVAQRCLSVAGVAKQGVGRDKGLVQRDFRRPAAVMQRQRGTPHARGVRRHQEQAAQGSLVSLAGQHRGDDEGVGVAAAQHQRLGALQEVAAARRLGACRHRLRQAARLRFAVGQRNPARPVCERGHQRFQLRRAGCRQQRLRGQHAAAEIWLDHQAAAQLGRNQHRVDDGTTEAAGRFRQRRGQPAVLGEHGPVLAVARLAGLDPRGAGFEIVVFVDEAAHAVLKQALFISQVEIHDRSVLQSWNIDLAMMVRCTSLVPP
ncbi:hypothetical protein D3C72_1195540 [compost metagenome]